MALGRRLLFCFGGVLAAVAVFGAVSLAEVARLKAGVAAGGMGPEAVETALSGITLTLLVGFAGTALLGVALAVLAHTGINRVIRAICGRMDEAAGQMDGTSHRILLSSRSLAEAAAKQASALEQTSSSLGEMSEMTRTYATNATQTDELIEASGGIIRQTSASVERLIESIEEMTRTASESRGIIRDIDEVAFQTNLLAINAGVEAARAGEAGLGFSVIADEVRNLAGRSAEAARRTVDLIEQSIRTVARSSELAVETAEAFRMIRESTEKVRAYVAEIAAASREQASGITQTHEALSEIRTSSEQTAAGAGETSEASGAINAQSETIRAALGDLIAFSYGNGNGVEKILHTVGGALRDLAADSGLSALIPREHEARLSRWMENHSRYVEAVYSNGADGAFVFSHPPAGIPDASIRPWWQKAMEGIAYVSPAYVSAITGKPCLTLSLPLRDRRGEIVGVLGADIRLG